MYMMRREKKVSARLAAESAGIPCVLGNFHLERAFADSSQFYLLFGEDMDTPF